jgi:DNA primase
MLAEHGIDYAVATLGTAVTQTHLERLFGAVGEVVFCFDGDEAGRQAAWRALTNTLPVLTDGREARFLFLPEGEDPDSMVRAEGAAAFEQRLSTARPLADFLIERLSAAVDTTSVGGRAQLAAEARPLLARMPSGVYHDLLIDRLATAVGLTAERLRADLAAGGGADRREARGRGGRRPPSAVRMTPMRLAIAVVLQHPRLAERIPGEHPAVAGSDPGAALLADLRRRALEDPQTSTARLLEAYRDTSELKHLERLAAYELATAEGVEPEAARARELDDALARIAERARGDRRADLIRASQERALTAAEKEELRALLRADPG